MVRRRKKLLYSKGEYDWRKKKVGIEGSWVRAQVVWASEMHHVSCPSSSCMTTLHKYYLCIYHPRMIHESMKHECLLIDPDRIKHQITHLREQCNWRVKQAREPADPLWAHLVPTNLQHHSEELHVSDND
jgi:hypothetical protein